jgi:hypothetical protein
MGFLLKKNGSLPTDLSSETHELVKTVHNLSLPKYHPIVQQFYILTNPYHSDSRNGMVINLKFYHFPNITVQIGAMPQFAQ